MEKMFIDLLLGQPLPEALEEAGISGCTVDPDAGLIAFMPTTGFLPSDFEGFTSRSCTLSVSRIHQFAVGFEFRFEPARVADEQQAEEKPLTSLFVHSPVLHKRATGRDVSRLIKAGMFVHLIAYDPDRLKIVAVRRAPMEERVAWKWRCLAEHQMKASHLFKPHGYEADMWLLLQVLPEPIPTEWVATSQVLPPPDELKVRLGIAGYHALEGS